MKNKNTPFFFSFLLPSVTFGTSIASSSMEHDKAAKQQRCFCSFTATKKSEAATVNTKENKKEGKRSEKDRYNGEGKGSQHLLCSAVKVAGQSPDNREKPSPNKEVHRRKKFYTSYSKLSEVKLITIGLASPERIKQWAEKTLPNGKILGEVINANTLHHKTFKPQKGGLFCERIFGPLKDFECACGKPLKFKKEDKLGTLKQFNRTASVEFSNENSVRDDMVYGEALPDYQVGLESQPDNQVRLPQNVHAGTDFYQDPLKNVLNLNKSILGGIGLSSTPSNGQFGQPFSTQPSTAQLVEGVRSMEKTKNFCNVCEVEYTWSVMRRYQLGYINLISPVTHVWYLKGNPSYLSILLDMKKRHLEYIVYCSETLTLENGLKGGIVSSKSSDIVSSWKKLKKKIMLQRALLSRLSTQPSTAQLVDGVEAVFTSTQPSIAQLVEGRSEVQGKKGKLKEGAVIKANHTKGFPAHMEHIPSFFVAKRPSDGQFGQPFSTQPSTSYAVEGCVVLPSAIEGVRSSEAKKKKSKFLQHKETETASLLCYCKPNQNRTIDFLYAQPWNRSNKTRFSFYKSVNSNRRLGYSQKQGFCEEALPSMQSSVLPSFAEGNTKGGTSGEQEIRQEIITYALHNKVTTKKVEKRQKLKLKKLRSWKQFCCFSSFSSCLDTLEKVKEDKLKVKTKGSCIASFTPSIAEGKTTQPSTAQLVEAGLLKSKRRPIKGEANKKIWYNFLVSPIMQMKYSSTVPDYLTNYSRKLYLKNLKYLSFLIIKAKQAKVARLSELKNFNCCSHFTDGPTFQNRILKISVKQILKKISIPSYILLNLNVLRDFELSPATVLVRGNPSKPSKSSLLLTPSTTQPLVVEGCVEVEGLPLTPFCLDLNLKATFSVAKKKNKFLQGLTPNLNKLVSNNLIDTPLPKVKRQKLLQQTYKKGLIRANKIFNKIDSISLFLHAPFLFDFTFSLVSQPKVPALNASTYADLQQNEKEGKVVGAPAWLVEAFPFFIGYKKKKENDHADLKDYAGPLNKKFSTACKAYDTLQKKKGFPLTNFTLYTQDNGGKFSTVAEKMLFLNNTMELYTLSNFPNSVSNFLISKFFKSTFSLNTFFHFHFININKIKQGEANFSLPDCFVSQSQKKQKNEGREGEKTKVKEDKLKIKYSLTSGRLKNFKDHKVAHFAPLKKNLTSIFLKVFLKNESVKYTTWTRFSNYLNLKAKIWSCPNIILEAKEEKTLPELPAGSLGHVPCPKTVTCKSGLPVSQVLAKFRPSDGQFGQPFSTQPSTSYAVEGCVVLPSAIEGVRSRPSMRSSEAKKKKEFKKIKNCLINFYLITACKTLFFDFDLLLPYFHTLPLFVLPTPSTTQPSTAQLVEGCVDLLQPKVETWKAFSYTFFININKKKQEEGVAVNQQLGAHMVDKGGKNPLKIKKQPYKNSSAKLSNAHFTEGKKKKKAYFFCININKKKAHLTEKNKLASFNNTIEQSCEGKRRSDTFSLLHWPHFTLSFCHRPSDGQFGQPFSTQPSTSYAVEAFKKEKTNKEGVSENGYFKFTLFMQSISKRDSFLPSLSTQPSTSFAVEGCVDKEGVEGHVKEEYTPKSVWGLAEDNLEPTKHFFGKRVMFHSPRSPNEHKKLYNNVYCLSHRERWEVENDWNFLYYYVTAQNFENENNSTAPYSLNTIEQNQFPIWSPNQTDQQTEIQSGHNGHMLQYINKIPLPSMIVLPSFAEGQSREGKRSSEDITASQVLPKIIPNYKNRFHLDKANLYNSTTADKSAFNLPGKLKGKEGQLKNKVSTGPEGFMHADFQRNPPSMFISFDLPSFFVPDLLQRSCVKLIQNNMVVLDKKQRSKKEGNSKSKLKISSYVEHMPKTTMQALSPKNHLLGNLGLRVGWTGIRGKSVLPAYVEDIPFSFLACTWPFFSLHSQGITVAKNQTMQGNADFQHNLGLCVPHTKGETLPSFFVAKRPSDVQFGQPFSTQPSTSYAVEGCVVEGVRRRPSMRSSEVKNKKRSKKEGNRILNLQLPSFAFGNTIVEGEKIKEGKQNNNIILFASPEVSPFVLPSFAEGKSKESNTIIEGRSEAQGKGNKKENEGKRDNTKNKIVSVNLNKSTLFSGPGIIQLLLSEFNFFEIKKMDKQNRILLYQLNKQILKLKKRILVPSSNREAINSTSFNKILKKYAKKELKESYKKRDLLIRRTKLVRKLFIKESPPQATILTVLPVLPPDLRPIVKMGGQIAASDLNRLYQRVIYRNDRLKKFLKDPATSHSYEMKYAQRLLQEAVDNLIQNGKSGVVTEKDSRGRALKSLSDILKGKQGRFRQYLLGKRVDYSGRSVIVVGPRLKLHECGIPKEMALELYLPFLLKRILNDNLARTVVGAKMLIKTNPSLVWELLREIMQTCPVLLNRAPTLHRLGIQAFQPKLIDGRAILLHPLVCSAFNADFDGDQMAVHVPITVEARAEAWKLMLSRNSILSPATGDPLAIPSQDMVLGCYYLTTSLTPSQIINSRPDGVFTVESPRGNATTEGRAFQNLGSGRASTPSTSYAVEGCVEKAPLPSLKEGVGTLTGFYFSKIEHALKAYELKKIDLHANIWLKWTVSGFIENGSDQEEPLEIRLDSFGNWKEIYSKSQKRYNFKNICLVHYIFTTPGKIIFNLVIQKALK